MFMCVFPCFMVRSLSSRACMLESMFFPYLCARLIHVDVYVSMPTRLDLCFHMPMCLDLCSLHALFHHLGACMLHALFMHLGLDLVCHAMCYCSPFVPFVVFSCVFS